SWQKARHHHFSLNDIYKNNTLIIIFLTVLLCSLFIHFRVSYYAIGFFTCASFLHFIYTKKFYALPKFFYFIFIYALLMFFGTIGTPKGFYFPDKTLSLYVLPLAFCCFCLPKKTLLKIGEIFFKTGIIFLVICILYWWFNFLYLNANFIEWIIQKQSYFAHPTGWEVQAKFILSGLINNNIPLQDVNWYSAFFFVDSWAYMYHPTPVSIVLLGGLITGFYLYFQKNEFYTVSKFDLILYAVLCLFVTLLIQSRIGTVGFFLIAGISVLYYLKLKLKIKYFKIALAVCILFGGLSFFAFNNKISNYINDDIRDVYRKIAVSYIQEHFWWGSGFNQQQSALEWQAEKMKDKLPEIAFPNDNQHITHAHNQFLGNMVQYGIWGLIVLIAMLAAIAYYAVKNRNYPLFTFLCFIIFFMLVEENEYIKILIFITFFTAISRNVKNSPHTLPLSKKGS
ncbi:MAG: O-antigen ligase family protein, partial [Paludibacter sp.]|nr:O-antigen ligase family protein [Paludibacter sp.]